MFRWFRLFEKKRGERRTGSTLQGRLSEAAFFGGLFLLGAICLSNIVVQEITNPSSAPRTIGLGFWLQVLVMASFMVIGGGGVLWAMFHSRTSVERRSAIVRNATNIDLVNETVPMPLDYPTLPHDTNLINSPGTLLAYRLPTVESPVWGLLAATIFCLLWNGLTCALTVYASRSWGTDRPEAFLTILLVPFIGVGCWAIHFLLRQLIVHTALGPLMLEISQHPLHPDRPYQLFISMTGQLRVQSLEVFCICEEQAEFHQGTDVRHEIAEPYRQLVFGVKDFRLDPATPFEQVVDFSIPAGAMHSFQTAHNSVQWKLVVTGVADGWPPFQRSYPVIVQPLALPTPATVAIRLPVRQDQFATVSEKVGA